MSASASASEAAWTPHMKLLTSLSRAPRPVAPTWRMARLIAVRTGRAVSSADAEPPTRKTSSPEAAWGLLPVTGASSSSQPRAAASLASSSIQPTVSVLHSTSTAPRLMPVRAPCSPSQIAREAASSATMLRTTSARAAASRGVAATWAPSAASDLARSGLRFHTVSGKPAPSRRRAMPEPMRPRPISATRVCCISYLQPRGWTHTSESAARETLTGLRSARPKPSKRISITSPS